MLSYARHHRLFKLSLSDALTWDLFHEPHIGRRLTLNDAREVMEFMRTKEGARTEWVDGKSGKGKADLCWVWWRRPEEWAEMLEKWVDDTAQRGGVLTLYEICEGEGSRGTGESFMVFDVGELWRGRGGARRFGACCAWD